MQVYFVRHGETSFNHQGRIMGQLDEPLDAAGIEQSKNLAAKIEPGFERFFCSPLARARQTAEIINQKLRLQIEYRDELRERNFGTLAGETLAEMNQNTKSEIARRDADQTYDYRPYGGEAVEDVKARLNNFLDFLRADAAGEKTLVVTHTGIIRLLYLMFGRQYPEIDNDSVHIFEI